MTDPHNFWKYLEEYQEVSWVLLKGEVLSVVVLLMEQKDLLLYLILLRLALSGEDFQILRLSSAAAHRGIRAEDRFMLLMRF